MSVCFLCKQKTAYEMRISDRSSDVCSSDLDVDSEGFSQFPGTRFKSIRLAGKRADRAEIDHIAGEFTLRGMFQISGDLHIFTAEDRPDLRDARYFFGEADASCALDETGNHRFPVGTHLLLLPRPLILIIAGIAFA